MVEQAQTNKENLMSDQLKRRRRLKWELVVHRPVELPLKPVISVPTVELKKFHSTLACYLGFDEDTPTYHQGLVILMQNVEKILRDTRFREYGWHIKRHQVALPNDLRQYADQALGSIVGIVRGRECVPLASEPGPVKNLHKKRKASNQEEYHSKK